MSRLQFRNLDVTPDDPVEEWGTEGILTAIDRGGFEDWVRVCRAFKSDPWGEVAQCTEEAVELAADKGASAFIAESLRRTRMSDKELFALKFSQWVRECGLSRAELAKYLGTSRSRLSTYESGQVTPSAVIAEKVRMLGVRRREKWAP